MLGLFFFSIVIHEVAHGWVADRLGDPTAKLAGRLTLNPLAHIDPIGTVLLPVTLAVLRSPVVFGWAKPVPINAWRLGSPRRDMMWVALAGPAANVGLAAILAALLRVIPSGLDPLLHTVAVLNLFLGAFNLVPIPPLDGSRVLFALAPRVVGQWLIRLEPYGFLLVLLAIWSGLVHRLVWPVVKMMSHLLGVGS